MEHSTPPPLPPQRQPPPSAHRTCKRRALFQITKVRLNTIIWSDNATPPPPPQAAYRSLHCRTMAPRPPAILNANGFFSQSMIRLISQIYFRFLFIRPHVQVFALVPAQFTKYGRPYYCYYVNTTTRELHLFYSKQSWLLSRLSKQPDIIIVLLHRASSYTYWIVFVNYTVWGYKTCVLSL